ncbi:hypothetical protein DEO72_LG8g1592 [Vigna unguiculata]|uniref:Uncharacterized protein n=1 Tax=Vigna unguiculata TaxID=3917 RepID=A0A4D6MUK2_VIGUN|nr:hypothetical protein DEO72_LG8g1592 [Vigna unguiculata]
MEVLLLQWLHGVDAESGGAGSGSFMALGGRANLVRDGLTMLQRLLAVELRFKHGCCARFCSSWWRSPLQLRTRRWCR